MDKDLVLTHALPLTPLLLVQYTAPSTTGLTYAETFSSDPFESGRWAKSSDSAYAGQSISIAPPDDPSPAFAADNGMKFNLPATKYGVVSKVSPAVSADGEDLVIQYELRLQEGLECGGAYLKLLTADADLSKFDDKSPYSIMFGPDKCGGTNKVHFIYKHKNPVTGEWEEKHAVSPPSIKPDSGLHLYTLIVRKDLSYEIRIDGKSEKHGKLDGKDDFSPSLLPEAEIDDPEDKKPEDWVDEAKIKDPEATKPEDWDEDAPKEIPDMDAEKPSGWMDDEPAMVDDPGAEMPEDWDEEEDGEWEAPQVPNPKCSVGCGTWERPTKANPDYKGKWTAPMIDNPAYKGVWKPQKIANPGFFAADDAAAKAPLASIGAVAIEIWTMQKGFHFDNVIVGNDVAAAERFAKETFETKAAQEEKRSATKAARESKRRRLEAYESGSFSGYATYYVGEAGDLIQQNMIASVVTLLLGLGMLIKFCCMGGDDDAYDDVTDEELRAQMAAAEGEDEDDADGAEESKGGDKPKIEEVPDEKPAEEKKTKKKRSSKKSKKAD